MIPAPHTATVRRWSAGAPDAHGVPADVWADEQISVHGVGPATDEATTGDYRADDSETITVYAPPGVSVAARDRIVWQGRTFEVVGDSVDWSAGPWQNTAAGVVIRARRTDG